MLKFTLKNYILTTLLLLSVILILCECSNLKVLIITKIISFVYIAILYKTNKKYLNPNK